uniref:Uncharacterized protein n=1 Tax=Arundo donax TaxID=35708 RepID=A0A0A9BL78_ARUDO
MNSTSSSSL